MLGFKCRNSCSGLKTLKTAMKQSITGGKEDLTDEEKKNRAEEGWNKASVWPGHQLDLGNVGLRCTTAAGGGSSEAPLISSPAAVFQWR